MPSPVGCPFDVLQEIVSTKVLLLSCAQIPSADHIAKVLPHGFIHIVPRFKTANFIFDNTFAILLQTVLFSC